jgi:uncharacterized protein DUF2278
MPLPAYGVAIGTYVSFARDPQDQYGRWYHGHLTIATPAGEYQSALDVDTPSGLGVSYRLSYGLDPSAFQTVAALPNGFHTLAPNPTSGALDYLRSGVFRDLVWPTSLRPPAMALDWLSPAAKDATLTMYEQMGMLVGRLMPLPEFLWHRPWVRSTGDNALSALESQLPGSHRVFIFGAPYTEGLGVHDVHMNQGDPAGTQWYATDGIWQDGCVLVERPDAKLFAWQVRFNSQAMTTDDAGHPI